MNDVDKMPPKCHDCSYWEIAREPHYCYECVPTKIRWCGNTWVYCDGECSTCQMNNTYVVNHT